MVCGEKTLAVYFNATDRKDLSYARIKLALYSRILLYYCHL